MCRASHLVRNDYIKLISNYMIFVDVFVYLFFFGRVSVICICYLENPFGDFSPIWFQF